MEANIEFRKLIKKCVLEGDLVEARNASCYRAKTVQNILFNRTPLVTIRPTAWKNALREMEWFLSGSSDINDLHPNVRHWWEPWADTNGLIYNNYSKQFRHYNGRFDSIAALISGIQNHPNSRRHVITTWNTEEMYNTNTPITNCHGSLIECIVNDGVLNLVMVQRAADVVLGLNHNWIQYWALLMYLAYHTGLTIGHFEWVGIICDVYADHIEVSNKILLHNEFMDKCPDLGYFPSSDKFLADDFALSAKPNYIYTDKLKMSV
jgi:thymidylate synthase